ncbi:MAG: hypothetical protein WB780_20390 [Candidatus Acidiferrales bacterium]
MPRVKSFEPLAAPPSVITEKTITKTTTAPMEVEEAAEPKDTMDISEWFASIPTGELRHFNFYLSRLSEEVRNADNPEKDTFMIRFIAPEMPMDTSETSRQRSINEVTQIDPNFWIAIQGWTADNAGGGAFRIMINSTKLGRSIYNKKFRIEGTPKPMKFETYRGPSQQAASNESNTQRLLEMVIKTIDEKLTAVTEGRQDPQAAFTQSLQAVSEIQTKAMEIAVSHIPKEAPPVNKLADLREAVEIVSILEKRNAGAPAADSKTQLKEMLELMALIEPRRNPPDEGLAEKITNGVVGGLKAAGMLGKRTATGTDWGWVEPTLKNLAPGAIQLLQPLVARFAAARTAAAPAAGQPIILQRGAAPASQPVMAAAPGNGTGLPLPLSLPTGSASPTPSAPPATPGPITITPEMANTVRWHDVTHAVVDWIRHDVPGNEAAAALKYVYPDYCAQLGAMPVVMLKGLFQSDVTLAEASSHPRLDAFIAEFLGFLNPPPEGPEPEDKPV